MLKKDIKNTICQKKVRSDTKNMTKQMEGSKDIKNTICQKKVRNDTKNIVKHIYQNIDFLYSINQEKEKKELNNIEIKNLKTYKIALMNLNHQE
jgi:hypothetical protein